MFVQPTDFDLAPYNIPHVAENGAMPDYIDQEEEERLRKILGNALYEALIAGLPDPDLQPQPPADRWTKLRDGETFVGIDGKTYRWFGLRKALTPYIYSRWLTDNYDTLTDSGVVVSETENATPINPSLRICRAFNKFSDYIGVHRCFYPISYYNYNTLYEYLYSKAADFDDVAQAVGYDQFFNYLFVEFDAPGRMNIFNI